VPWFPAPASGAPPPLELDRVPTAPHPARRAVHLVALVVGFAVGAPLGEDLLSNAPASWGTLGKALVPVLLAGTLPALGRIGPAAVALIGYALGVALNRGSLVEADAWAYPWDAFDGPATVAIASTLAAVVLLHLQRGEAPAPAGHALAHRLALRALVRGAVAGPLAGLAASFAQDRYDDLWPSAIAGCSAIAATLAVAEALALRAPPRLRWPSLLAWGLVAPILAYLAGLFMLALTVHGEPLAALDRVLGELSRSLDRQPTVMLGWIAASAPPFALVAAMRTGTLPYLGHRAPWPLLAQLPLAVLSGALFLALVQHLAQTVSTRHFVSSAAFVTAGALTLVVSLRLLCEPLERRLVARWLVFTGGSG
jgi:hypothetical protein